MGEAAGVATWEQVAALKKWLGTGSPASSLKEVVCLLEAALDAEDVEARDVARDCVLRMTTPFPPRSWSQVSGQVGPGLEPVLVWALSRPEQELLRVALEHAPELAGRPGRATPAIAARLAHAVPGIVLAAARALWLCAREGADLEPAKEPVERALKSAQENVAFFCALALSHHRLRRGEDPPAIPAPSGKPDLGGYGGFVQSGWSARVLLSLPDGNRMDRPTLSPRDCLACGAPGAKQVFYDSEGGNAGGTFYYGYRCAACGLYMMEEQDWG